VIQVGDRVRIVHDSAPVKNRSDVAHAQGRAGIVSMILDDDLLIIEVDTPGGPLSLSAWPDDVQFLPEVE
jgi:hypothetical protein